MKPECEKSWKEKFKDGLKKVGQWCREHWKAVATILIVITAVIIMCTGVGGILGAMALGALIGSTVGGILGGIMNKVSGKSFWQGFEDGAFTGAVSGIITGGMTWSFTGGNMFKAFTLKQTLALGGTVGAIPQFASDVGDIIIKGSNISLGQLILNVGISGGLGVAFAGIGYGLSKGFSALKVKLFNRIRVEKVL